MTYNSEFLQEYVESWDMNYIYVTHTQSDNAIFIYGMYRIPCDTNNEKIQIYASHKILKGFETKTKIKKFLNNIEDKNER